MASAYKILGQSVVALNAGMVIIDTVPSNKNYIISSLVVSGLSGTEKYVAKISVYAIKSGGSIDTSTAILYEVPVEKNTDVSFSLGITLGPGDRLYASTSTNCSITFTAFGEEITL